jgi:hypothetical protein
VFERKQIALSIGDRIRFTKNVKRRGQKFFNNELRTVIGIDEGRIIFDKGEMLRKRQRPAYRSGNRSHQSRKPSQNRRPSDCQISAMQMIDVYLPTSDGRTIILSRYTQPETELQLLLNQLKLQLPDQPPPRITAAGHLSP